MVEPSPTSRSTSRTNGGATTPAGCRRPRRSGWAARWRASPWRGARCNPRGACRGDGVARAALLVATPTLVLFGALSDRIGRKPIILAGFLLAAVTYFPLYSALGASVEPGHVSYLMAVLVVAVLVSYVGMVYGPIAAFL